MARDPKIEVAALNVRIPIDANRDYASLLETISSLKRGVRIHGESYCAIRSFNKKLGIGIVSKYTEIDIDGEWFDLDDFDRARPEALDDISIPSNLKPNHAAFYFKLSEDLHTIVFETYSESKSLSAASFEKYFKDILRIKEIRQVFGRVEADIIKDYTEVDKILALPDLKELQIVIRRPNSDDIDDKLARVIERRLSEQDGDEYQEILKARGKHNLKPNERTKILAGVAADNGQVHAKSIVNGVMTSQDTISVPLTETTTFKASLVESSLQIFTDVAEKLLSRISTHRAR